MPLDNELKQTKRNLPKPQRTTGVSSLATGSVTGIPGSTPNRRLSGATGEPTSRRCCSDLRRLAPWCLAPRLNTQEKDG
jgi:hypothetical protein